MRRVKSKGKKLSAATNHDEPTSDEEKIPTQKRRGRPHKAIKDETEEDSEETANGGGSENRESRANSIGSKKRKNNGDTKGEVVEYPKDEKLPGDDENNTGRSKLTRHRRKGKPCRAPEAVVECT